MTEYTKEEQGKEIPPLSFEPGEWDTYCGSVINLHDPAHILWREQNHIVLDGNPVRVFHEGKVRWMDVSSKDFGTLFD